MCVSAWRRPLSPVPGKVQAPSTQTKTKTETRKFVSAFCHDVRPTALRPVSKTEPCDPRTGSTCDSLPPFHYAATLKKCIPAQRHPLARGREQYAGTH